MVTLFSNQDKLTLFWKAGRPFRIEIIAKNDLDISDNFKNNVDQLLGNKDTYQWSGKSDQKLNLELFLKSESHYNDLVSFFKDGKPFSLQISDIIAPFRLDGSLKSTKSWFDGSYITQLSLTSAQEPSYYPSTFDIYKEKLGNKFDKSDLLTKIKKWGKSVIDFTGNTNSAFSSCTGKWAEYATAITQFTGGIGSTSTIVTSQISSVRNSISSVIGGVSSALNSIGTAINAVKQVPSDIDKMVEALADIGNQFSNIFNLDNKAEQLKITTNFLIDTATALTTVSETSVSTKIIIEDPYEIYYDPEIIVSENDSNLTGLSVLILASILLEIYEQFSQIVKWNKSDLDNILSKTETLYEYITSKDINTEVRTGLVLARNSFFASFQILYINAYKIIEVQVITPSFLNDIVYSVNGNFDYYLDTKKLNNIIGSVVQGKIKVISNE